MCIANAVAAQDPAGNRKLDKARSRSRIDGAVCLAMALGIRATDAPQDLGYVTDSLVAL
jgi:phage terminase large subunit-like protein